MLRKAVSMILVLTMTIAILVSCGKASGKTSPQDLINDKLDTEKDIVLRVIGPWDNFKALDAVSTKFNEKYKNCTIQYEYLQDYYKSLETRLASDDNSVDLFITTNIKKGNTLMPYTLDLYTDDRVDISQAFDGLVRNFEYIPDEGETALYAVPLGAELRGMYVNCTLLDSLGIDVPKNLDDFLSACKTLKEAGYIPLQGNPGAFGQHIMYPYFANIIANSDNSETIYDDINTRKDGAAEYFREPAQLLYNIVENGYYDYKTAQSTLNLFNGASDEEYARDFLNIVSRGEDEYEKSDDVGRVAFMPSAISLKSVIDQIKEDYHSKIEYKFMLSPLSEDGGFAYMSPAHGLAINASSENLDWAIEFFNYMYIPDINIMFCQEHNIIPNTKEAMTVIEDEFDISKNHISHLGQATFDYAFYDLARYTLTEISKANNPKYMKDDGNGGTVMNDFEYYMDRFNQRIIGTLVDE